MARIHLSKADVTEVEESFVIDAMRSGWIAPLGPHVDAFEAEIAERCGVASALALSSGTAALHLALLVLGARPGTVVVCSSFTFAASAYAIAYTGATPVFVDSQPSDGNVDSQLLLDSVDTLQQEGKTVVAAMVVDLFGRCADYEVISAGLAQRKVPLLEDAAEALGASLAGQSAGSFGSAAALSFNGNKIMTTSGGGMLLSQDPDLTARARFLSTQARDPVPWYEHSEIGYNYRLSNVLAALGRGQLTRLNDMLTRRRTIRQHYVEALGSLPGVRFLGNEPDRDDAADNCWLTTMVLDEDAPLAAESLIEKLAAEDIEARHLWKPMHLQPIFADARMFDQGCAAELFRTGLALPSGSALSDDEVARVVSVTRHALGSTP